MIKITKENVYNFKNGTKFHTKKLYNELRISEKNIGKISNRFD